MRENFTEVTKIIPRRFSNDCLKKKTYITLMYSRVQKDSGSACNKDRECRTVNRVS